MVPLTQGVRRRDSPRDPSPLHLPPIAIAMGRVGHAVLAAFMVMVISYLLGNGILTGSIKGNDSHLHIGYIIWAAEYFPELPHWYPSVGGGVSLLHGYPIFAHFLTALISLATNLSLVQSYRLITFLAFPLTAMGIYLFCWSSLKTQTVGLIAAVFYLLAPVTWTWMHDWGFFASHVGLAFLPLALLAYDKVFKDSVARERSGRRRIWLVFLVVMIILAGVSHMMVGAAAVAGMILYTASMVVSGQKGNREFMLRSGVRVLSLAGLIAGMVAAAYIVPFYAYGNVANREGANTPAPSQLNRLPIAEFLGMSPINPSEVLTRMQFPLLEILFGVVGLLLALIYVRKGSQRSQSALAIGVAGVIATIYVLSPGLVSVVLKTSRLLVMFLNFRSLMYVAMMFIPVTAGYGVWALALSLVYPKRLLQASGNLKTGGRRRLSLRPAMVSMGSLVILGATVLPLGSRYSVGPSSFDPSTSPLGKDFTSLWEVSALEDADSSIAAIKEIASHLPEDPNSRVSISPLLGHLAQDFSIYSDVSQLDTYTNQLSLIHLMWGHQLSVFYSDEVGSAEAINELAYWMGIDYALLDLKRDPMAKFDAAQWDVVFEDEGLQIRQDPRGTQLASLSTRPTILVIGDEDKFVYAEIFRLANQGLAPYEEFLLVEGGSRIDTYSIEDLKLFDVLFLHGYQYKDGKKAWDVLTEYVRQGGSLFIDTGWQFVIPEWEFERAPEVLPVSRLTWTNYGQQARYQLQSVEIAGNIQPAEFAPLVWGDDPWSVSGAENEDLRDWGQTILSDGGHPLIVAGELGQGRVVWSGMNLIPHIIAYDNEEEILFLHNLLSWLGGEPERSDEAAPVVNRSHPDQVNFDLQVIPGDQNWLLWREAYYPDWHAYLVDGGGSREIPIYRGGPGFMLMPIQAVSENASVNLQWEPSLSEKVAGYVSVLGGLFLSAILADGLLLGGNGLSWLKIAALTRIPRPFLGEGSNKEWAERKRRELTEGELASGPRIYQPSEAIPWMRPESEIAPEATDPSNSNGQDPEVPETIEENEKLLESWLAETGHSEDAWAERLLSKRPTSRET